MCVMLLDYAILNSTPTKLAEKYAFAAYMKISFSLQIPRKPSQKCSTNIEME